MIVQCEVIQVRVMENLLSKKRYQYSKSIHLFTHQSLPIFYGIHNWLIPVLLQFRNILVCLYQHTSSVYSKASFLLIKSVTVTMFVSSTHSLGSSPRAISQAKPLESYVRGAHLSSQRSWDVLDIWNVILCESDLLTSIF